MTENSTALLFDILDTATQGDPDSAANNIALLNQLLSATDNDPSNISANEIALLTEILSIITDQPPDVAANEIALLTEILSAIQSQNPQVRANKIALLNEIAANSQSLVDALNPVTLPVAASDLVAWYPFRAGTGEDITAGDSRFGDSTDYSATVNGATFQASGGVTDIQTGANSGAFELDGTDDFLELPDGNFTEQTFTALGWVFLNSVSAQRLLSPGYNGTTHPPHISINSGVLEVRSFDGSSDTTLATSANVGTGNYLFWGVSVDYSTNDCKLYTDGVKQTSGKLNNLATNNADYYIGGFDNNGPLQGFINGLCDEFRIYDSILSDSQINQIYLNTEP
ncbi:hypothetical protein 7908G4C8_35 [Haloquadratum phage sp.]|nr:hypothetical protein 7908G4C8_35 [Haloquadratum phage sp.]